MYNIFRSKFLNKCLCKPGVHEINLHDVDNGNFGNLIKAFHTVLRILLPNERNIRLLFWFSTKHDIFSSSEWRRMEIKLRAKFMVLETRIRYKISKEDFLDYGIHPLTREVLKCILNASKDADNANCFNVP